MTIKSLDVLRIIQVIITEPVRDMRLRGQNLRKTNSEIKIAQQRALDERTVTTLAIDIALLNNNLQPRKTNEGQ